MYDVIVVGARSAGCTASKVLAEKGYKVLLVEKFKIPRYKSCSGVLIKKSMELVKIYFGEDVPESAMCTPTDSRGMIFTNDKGKEYRFEQEGLNVWRSHFDGWLTKKAEESGAEVRDGVSALSCTEQDGFVEVRLHGKNNYTESARFVLDCEGVVGTLKRQIAVQYAGKITGEIPGYITTFQTFNEGSIDLYLHYFYAYLQPELLEYDAWFNVKDDLLVLGVLFAGEVAGFLNPMGEGIFAGMESGYFAAYAIMEHFDNPQVACEAYRQSTKSLKSYMQRQWSLVGGMAGTFKEME